MAFLKQVFLTLVFLLIAGAVWLHLSPAPGRYLLAESTGTPEPFRSWVSALSPADDDPKIGATPRSTGSHVNAPLVVADPAVPSVTRDRLRALGTAEAVKTVAVRPEVSGIVETIGFRSGDRVDAGSLLAALRDDTQRVAVERARITLAAAEEQLVRYASLVNSSSITAVQLDEVRRARDAAKLDLRTAEIALDDRSIRAPIAGRVGISDLDVGALVDSSTLIATVDDRSKLKIVFYVPEAFVPELKIGHPVSAVPANRSAEPREGVISALDSRLDQASRTLRAEATIDNGDDALRPGMSFNVEIGFAGESFLAVSPLAIQWERTGPFVWVVRDGAAEKAEVRIVERNVDRVLVASSSLKEGERVISEGVQQLRPGLAVRVQEPVVVPPPPSSPDADAPSAQAEPANGRRAAHEAPAGGQEG